MRARAVAAGGVERILGVVRRIPPGSVATYGQIAALAGLPGRARQVGHALAALPDGSEVPWQRVINSKGEVSERTAAFDGAPRQRLLLIEEGIEFDRAGRVDLDRFGWEPGEEGPGRVARSAALRQERGGSG